MIEARQLTKRYGSFLALDQASFEVAGGRVAGFLGLNGAGKTTTLRIISCFLPPSSGSVAVGGHDTVRASHQVRSLVGYLPERVPLYEDMRVEEYLRFRARLKGLAGRAARESTTRVLGRVDLDFKRRALIGTLSKGQRQRVGLADALVHDPKLLILDEPTSGLDPDQRMEVRNLIRDLGQERTVLVSTHILTEAEAVCDDVIIVDRGRIRANESLQALRERSQSRVLLRHAGAALPKSGYAAKPMEGPKAGDEGADETTVVFATAEAASAAAAACVSAGRTLLELRPTGQSLEEIFLSLTSVRESADATPEGRPS